MNYDVESRLRRANLVTRDEQLDQLFAKNLSDLLLEDILARSERRPTDATGRPPQAPETHIASIQATADRTAAHLAVRSRAAGWLRPALASLLVMILAGAAIAAIFAKRESELGSPGIIDEQSVPWSPDSQFQDWPGPIRVEPTITTEAVIVGHGGDGIYGDPVGDVGLAVVDIIEVFTEVGRWGLPSLDRDVYFRLAGSMNLIPDPRDQWIAYGIVVDYTNDGRPDARYGIDNASDGSRELPPGFPPDADLGLGEVLRIWRTDLTTRANQVPFCCEDQMLMDAVFPFPRGSFDEAGRGSMFVVAEQNERVFHFYVWASVIRDGRVVATDYAPDAGWIAIGRP